MVGERIKNMIDVKRAVAAAMEGAKVFYAEQEMRGLQLEEVEKSTDDEDWLVTLSFFVPDPNPPVNMIEIAMQSSSLTNKKYERKYKVFKINAESGTVISMKMRE